MTKIKIDPCVVHCPTQEKWDMLLEWLKENTDLKADDEDMHWGLWRKKSCIDTEDGSINYCNTDHYLLCEKSPTPITLEQFMEKYDKRMSPKQASDQFVEAFNAIQCPPRRTWEITTEAKSSDGILVREDLLLVEYEAEGVLTSVLLRPDEARDLMNKLRKGLEQHKKLFNS